MAEKYIQTAVRVGWLLQELESELTAVNDGFVVDPLFVRNGAKKRLPTPDEIVTAINALTDLRVLRREGTTFYLNKQYLRDTEEFRAGAWQTIETLKSEHGEANRVSLCVAQGDKNIQTFHFKAAVADQGTKAYLGSANLTTSGLRSRMELGVILTGEVAGQLHRVIVAALALASPAF